VDEAGGRISKERKAGLLKAPQKRILEYHNRLLEVLRLTERRAPRDVLRDHLKHLDQEKILYKREHVGSAPKKAAFERRVTGSDPGEQIPALEKRVDDLKEALGL